MFFGRWSEDGDDVCSFQESASPPSLDSPLENQLAKISKRNEKNLICILEQTRSNAFREWRDEKEVQRKFELAMEHSSLIVWKQENLSHEYGRKCGEERIV